MPVPMSGNQIVEDLAERIERGEYAPGDKLPSYNELAELYGVKFGTIARVVMVLRDRGLVVGRAGKGVYVAEHKS